MAVRTVLVSSHTLFRDVLGRALECSKEFQVLCYHPDCTTLLRTIAVTQPELVISTMQLPGPSPIEVMRDIKRQYPKTKFVFVTSSELEENLFAAFRAGADGYVLKRNSYAELLTALRKVMRGERFVTPEMMHHLVNSMGRSDTPQDAQPRQAYLTSREKEVLKLLAEGNTVKETAVVLGVGVKTVDSHKYRIMMKLKVHNKAQLVHYAVQRGIVRLASI